MKIARSAQKILYAVIGDYEALPTLPEHQQAVLYNHEILRKALTAGTLLLPVAYRSVAGVRDVPEIPVYFLAGAGYLLGRYICPEILHGLDKTRKRYRKDTHCEDNDWDTRS